MSGQPDRQISEPPAEADDQALMSEAEIDFNVMGSFPASDPPSWTLGIRRRKKPFKESEGDARDGDEPHLSE